MNNRSGKNKKELLPALIMNLSAVLAGAVGLYACQNAWKLSAGALLIVLILAAVLALAFVGAGIFAKKAAQKSEELEGQSRWYNAVLDAIDFPIHVTDSDMRWTFMNRAFEKLMISQGNIKDRESSYGRACSNAGANICNTENCGINQLKKGVGQSYFEWCGMNCKQDTSHLVNEQGERIVFF